ncbi:hypothetical protein PO909_027731 [Leuciscus waleckii]
MELIKGDRKVILVSVISAAGFHSLQIPTYATKHQVWLHASFMSKMGEYENFKTQKRPLGKQTNKMTASVLAQSNLGSQYWQVVVFPPARGSITFKMDYLCIQYNKHKLISIYLTFQLCSQWQGLKSRKVAQKTCCRPEVMHHIRTHTNSINIFRWHLNAAIKSEIMMLSARGQSASWRPCIYTSKCHIA